MKTYVVLGQNNNYNEANFFCIGVTDSEESTIDMMAQSDAECKWWEVKELKIKGSITDEEIDDYGRFTNDEKKIIREQYSKHKKGKFPNPRCALY